MRHWIEGWKSLRSVKLGLWWNVLQKLTSFKTNVQIFFLNAQNLNSCIAFGKSQKALKRSDCEKRIDCDASETMAPADN